MYFLFLSFRIILQNRQEQQLQERCRQQELSGTE